MFSTFSESTRTVPTDSKTESLGTVLVDSLKLKIKKLLTKVYENVIMLANEKYFMLSKPIYQT